MDDFSGSGRDQILEMFMFESNQLLEQLEEVMLETEQSNILSDDGVNEIFRIMHTIKGSSAMMEYNNISKVSHVLEDLFFLIRENEPQDLDIEAVCDFVLLTSDFIKGEIAKIESGVNPNGDEKGITEKIENFIKQLNMDYSSNGTDASISQKIAPVQNRVTDNNKKRYKVALEFDNDTQMVNVRAFSIYNNIEKLASEIFSYPENILSCKDDEILLNGTLIFFSSAIDESEIKQAFEGSLYLKSYALEQVDSYDDELIKYNLDNKFDINNEENDGKADSAFVQAAVAAQKIEIKNSNDYQQKNNKLNLISVNVNKLDMLMDTVGEIVISEAMVTKNPEIVNLKLDSFNKAARQLRKLTDELQDIVMSIRMVPVSGTFQKMRRIVRDMSKKLGKEVDFVTQGEDTEVDKNIVDSLADPLMHIIRNSMDHGLESEETRIKSGKPQKGIITLSAVNVGGEIVISVSDDGRGLDKNVILKKARENGLLNKPDNEYTEKEIFQFIMLPGFSTSEKVTEFSGRGVGMDVVKKNIEKVGGSIAINSEEGKGTIISIIIPLTLAIVDAMELKVGNSIYSLPKISIKESFRPNENDIIRDECGNEMIMIRGLCYPIIRLHKIFEQETKITELNEGVLIIIEGDGKSACIFTDMIIGEQQVVVKPLPQYLSQFSLKETGVEGCTILGNGAISLILDAKNLIGSII